MDKLAAFEPTDLPVISLYLNAQANQHGRDNFDSFIRKEFKVKSKSFPLRSPARMSFEKDSERINTYLKNLRPSANGVAIFACAGLTISFWRSNSMPQFPIIDSTSITSHTFIPSRDLAISIRATLHLSPIQTQRGYMFSGSVKSSARMWLGTRTSTKLNLAVGRKPAINATSKNIT